MLGQIMCVEYVLWDREWFSEKISGKFLKLLPTQLVIWSTQTVPNEGHPKIQNPWNDAKSKKTKPNKNAPQETDTKKFEQWTDMVKQ